MTHDEIIKQMNQHRPACINTLKGEVLSFSAEKGELSMQFEPGLHCCHTVDIVQGGYITAMLDAAMAHVVLGVEKFQVQLSSIDINVSFLRPTRAGKYVAVGSIVKLGKNIGYLKAELFNAQGELTASATSSAYLSRKTEKKSVGDTPAQGFGL